MICSVCQTTLSRCDIATGVNMANVLPHHRDWSTFRKSLAEGCYICNRVWANLKPNEPYPYPLALCDAACDSRTKTCTSEKSEANEAPISNSEYETELTLRETPFHGLPPGSYLMDIVVLVDVEGARGSEHTGFYLLPRNTDDEIKVPATELSPDTKSPDVLRLANKWLADCVANHPQCRNPVGIGSWYPTRLIDCGFPDKTSPWCRVVETSSVSRGAYMTLSHHWGSQNRLQLTTECYTRFLDRISIAELPKLFQDAIYVVRAFGIQYLWIDSMCILQQGDDGTDLHHELIQMDKIYSNSHCNISATTDTTDDNHSLFRSRNPRALRQDIVTLASQDQNLRFIVTDRDFWGRELSESLINTRAWVLQERLLSPRILHFGTYEIFWECCTKDATESWPDGLPIDVFPFHEQFKALSPNGLVGIKESRGNIAAYGQWRTIVEAYTTCNLTYPSDKLAALSAIASRMSSILSDEYVAGMWRGHLEEELLWHVSRDEIRKGSSSNQSLPTYHAPNHFLSTYRAPTWSWAAVDGKIWPGFPCYPKVDLLISVEDVWLEYTTNNSKINIRNGWLKLRGVLKQLTLSPYHSPRGILRREYYMVINGRSVSAPRGDFQELDPHVFLDHPDAKYVESDNAAKTLYCMPARVYKGSKTGIFILLFQLCDKEYNLFRRIGLAIGWDEGLAEKILNDCTHEGEDQFPCEEYRDGKHTIRVI
ncbi:heterokaryon incompatibility protein [Xylariaceae sp. FL0255]|nr:heterokaryon incompatibility protein [Xylariaceae sp. FL0255]